MASEYLPFASETGANVITQAQWTTLLDRPRGFQAGLARSEEFNKVWRQASVMAAAVAHFIDLRVPTDVLDDGNFVRLATQLTQAIIAATGSEDTRLPEAPTDGRWFLRRNADWADSTNLSLDGGSW